MLGDITHIFQIPLSWLREVDAEVFKSAPGNMLQRRRTSDGGSIWEVDQDSFNSSVLDVASSAGFASQADMTQAQADIGTLELAVAGLSGLDAETVAAIQALVNQIGSANILTDSDIGDTVAAQSHTHVCTEITDLASTYVQISSIGSSGGPAAYEHTHSYDEISDIDDLIENLIEATDITTPGTTVGLSYSGSYTVCSPNHGHLHTDITDWNSAISGSFVTLGTAQTITGAKKFSQWIKIYGDADSPGTTVARGYVGLYSDTPFLDFHLGGASSYTSRFIDTSNSLQLIASGSGRAIRLDASNVERTTHPALAALADASKAIPTCGWTNSNFVKKTDVGNAQGGVAAYTHTHTHDAISDWSSITGTFLDVVHLATNGSIVGLGWTDSSHYVCPANHGHLLEDVTDFEDEIGDYCVTLATAQTITGAKKFSQWIKICGDADSPGTTVARGYVGLYSDTPFLDFHLGGASSYTSRFIDTSNCLQLIASGSGRAIRLDASNVERTTHPGSGALDDASKSVPTCGWVNHNFVATTDVGNEQGGVASYTHTHTHDAISDWDNATLAFLDTLDITTAGDTVGLGYQGSLSVCNPNHGHVFDDITDVDSDHLVNGVWTFAGVNVGGDTGLSLETLGQSCTINFGSSGHMTGFSSMLIISDFSSILVGDENASISLSGDVTASFPDADPTDVSSYNVATCGWVASHFSASDLTDNLTVCTGVTWNGTKLQMTKRAVSITNGVVTSIGNETTEDIDTPVVYNAS